jgi:AraC-like DNA-binding protein
LRTLSNRDADFAFGDNSGDDGRPRFTRSALLSAIADAARALGLDPYHMLRRAGIPIAALDHADHLAPADRVQALLADCAKAADCEEFGLLAGASYRLAMLGPLGLLLREQATVRDAVAALQRYIRYQDENLEVRAERRGGGLMLSPQLLSPRTRASRLMVEMSLASLAQVFRGLIGGDWRPAHVAFALPAPRDPGAYAAVLGPVAFGAPVTGFLLTAEDLATPLPEADPAMAREVARFIEASALPQGASMAETVRALVARLLPGGECTVDRVAEHLAMDRRTVHRRLAAEGQSFTQILEQTRREVATWQLRHGRQPLSEVTALVGFSSLSTFSRWFRQAYGVQPSEYRRQQQVA